jgi:predicted secreted protein
MGIAPALVLFAVTWFLTIFVVLPVRLKTQGDVGQVVPGTQAGAPANFRVGRTMLIVTGIATVIWLALVLVIVYGGITVRDIDLFHRMGPPAG